jgi:DNA mismatch repair protein MSH6
MMIVQSVLRELATNTLPLTLFATHYSSLTEMGDKHPNIRNMTMETVVDEERRQVSIILSKSANHTNHFLHSW